MDRLKDLRVFVYGTLQPGGLYWDRFCEGRVEVVGPAKVPGTLYGLPAGYPALSLEGEGWVHGVILELDSADTLAGIDGLEGFRPGRPSEENEYDRRKVEAFDGNGSPLGPVWTYAMDLGRIKQAGGRFIESDSWPVG